MPFLREAMSRAWPEWQANAAWQPDIYGECRGRVVTVVSNN